MPKLPNAPDPDRLRRLEPSLVTLASGTSVHRIYRRGGAHPTLWNAFRHFGPTASRFDHHLLDDDGRPHEQPRGVIYLARDITTAIAEVFQQERLIDRAEGQPWLVSSELSRDLSLLDLSGTFPLRAGGSMKLVSGPTVHARAWSRGFHDAYPDAHGLLYPSSLTNRPAVVLYERASTPSPFVEPPRFHRALRDALLMEPLRNAAREIGYDLL